MIAEAQFKVEQELASQEAEKAKAIAQEIETNENKIAYEEDYEETAKTYLLAIVASVMSLASLIALCFYCSSNGCKKPRMNNPKDR